MNKEFGFAVSLLVGFYALLRTGELLALRKNDISCTVQTGVAVIILGYTKGGKRMGVSESVTLTNETAVRFVKRWLKLAQDGQRVKPLFLQLPLGEQFSVKAL